MNVNKKKQKKNTLEFFKWLIIAVILLITIVGNYYYRNINYNIRLLIILSLTFITIWFSFLTLKGRSILSFILEAKIEAKKVIWPTRQETFHTTLIIIAITIFMSLVFWGLDNFLIFVISFFTNLRF